MVYTNLYCTDGIIDFEVKKYPITISLEDFTHIYNFPFMEQDYDKMDLEGNKFNFDTLAHSLLTDPISNIPYPVNVALISQNIRIIHYTKRRVMFPRKGNYKMRQMQFFII